MKNHTTFITFLIAFLLCSTHSDLFAQTPQSINYQAVARDGADIMSNQTVNVRFSVLQGVGMATVYQEHHTVTTNEHGLFTLGLGTGNIDFGSFTSIAWGNDIHSLKVELNTGSGYVNMGTTQMVSVPYSLYAGSADKAENMNINDLLDVSAATPGVGEALKWTGSNWTPSADLNNQIWNTSGTSAYYNTGKVGIGTSSPSDFVQIDAASLTNAFRVRIGGSTKFRVNSNGSITVGTLGAGPDNGLYVAGSVGVGTSGPTGRFQIIPLGNINSSSTLDATKAGLIIGSSSSGIIMDANQIEGQGATLNLNFNSTSHLSLVQGGGKVAIGHSSPSTKLDVQSEGWQFRIKNEANGGDDWFIGASNASWAVGRRKFLISPSSSSNSSIFSIDSAGYVGIGTTNQKTKLHILGGNDVGILGGGYLTLGSITATNIGIDNNEIMARNNGATSTLYLNANGGAISLRTSGSSNITNDVNITGSIKLYLAASEDFIIDRSASNTDPTLYSTASEYGLIGKSGNEMFNIRSKRFYAETSFNYLAYSDRRIKENIRLIDKPLETINKIDGVAYDIKREHYYSSERDKDEFTRTHQMGFIAQDIEKVLPQLVQLDEETGLNTVGYMGLIPVLVEALKELNELLDEQDQLIEALDLRVDMLEGR